jgi:pyrroline-5-carboxylate reductase
LFPIMTGTLLLVGCGKMGGALLDGWLNAGIVERVVVVEPAGLPPAVQGRPAVTVLADLAALPPGFVPGTVVLAIKPQAMDAALPAYARFAGPETTFLSIAAGKTIACFERVLGSGAAVVRAMPNTPAAIGHGMTVAVANAPVTAEARALCDALLRAVGDVAWVEDEGLIDAVTAVSGSGPAYVFLMVEALAAAGAAAGLPPDLSLRLARATVAGSGTLLDASPEPADALRRAVTSPGGTTQAALDVLMADPGLTRLMTDAVAAAARRSRELAG